MSVDPFVWLMRRYCNDYTNRQDTSVCPEIMEDDYSLRMGAFDLVGRDDAYIPAAEAQFRQFPGLCLTVHELHTNGTRLALRFTEHGGSLRHGGRAAAWAGIALYAWNGSRLQRCAVEQDYYSRRIQLDQGTPHAVEGPAVDPWSTVARPEDDEAAQIVRDLLERDALASPTLVVNDGGADRTSEPSLDVDGVHVDDIFSAGTTVAFRLTMTGTYRGGLAGCDAYLGSAVDHYATGLVHVEDGAVRGHVVTDRLGLSRRLSEPVNARG
jgi:predicted ester cyclase